MQNAALPQHLDLAALYRAHSAAVLRRIRRFYRAEVAHDVLQEVFERAVRKADTFRGECPPLAWLYALTTRHCLARLRDERRRRELLDEVGEIPWSRPITPSNQEATVFLQQLWQTVDEDLCFIGTCYFVDGMTQADIGVLLGVTGRTVGNRLKELTALARAAAEDHGGAA